MTKGAGLMTPAVSQVIILAPLGDSGWTHLKQAVCPGRTVMVIPEEETAPP